MQLGCLGKHMYHYDENGRILLLLKQSKTWNKLMTSPSLLMENEFLQRTMDISIQSSF